MGLLGDIGGAIGGAIGGGGGGGDDDGGDSGGGGGGDTGGGGFNSGGGAGNEAGDGISGGADYGGGDDGGDAGGSDDSGGGGGFFGGGGDDGGGSGGGGGGFDVGDARDAVGDAVSGVGNTVDNAVDTGTDAVADVGDTVTDIGSGAADTVDDAVDTGTDAVADVGDTVTDVGSGVADTVDNAVDTGTDAVADVGDTIDRGVDTVTDVGNDVQETVNSGVDTVADVGGDVADTATDVGETIQGAADTVADVGDVDAATGVDPTVDVGETATGSGMGVVSGGVPDEPQVSFEGPADAPESVDPFFGGGPIAEVGSDIDQATERFGRAGEQVREDVVEPSADFVGNVGDLYRLGRQDVSADDIDMSGEPNTAFGRTLEGGIAGVGGLAAEGVAAPDTATDLARTGAEAAEYTAAAIDEQGVVEGLGTAGAAAGAVGAGIAAQGAESVAENPARSTGLAAGSLFGGAALGRGAGVAARGVKDRVRTAGGERIDPEEVTNPDTVAYYEGRSDDPDAQFPGAEDPDLYESDPAAAVRQQAREYTPNEINEVFGGPATGDEATVFKAVDVEPGGPERGRAAQGFSAPEADTDAADAYESPGSFVGPELSPNFLGLSGEGGMSLRPGLPDTGNNPTAVAARTEVENPDAETMAGVNEELVERQGEPTAVTKPADAVNTGEIEAMVPPGAQFTPANSPGLFNRLGVGGDFYTEVGGRRVPIRPVEPQGARRQTADADAPDADASAESLSYYVEEPEQPTDRPAPVSGSGEPSATSTGPAPGDTSVPPATESIGVDQSVELFGGRPSSDRQAPSSGPTMMSLDSTTASSGGGMSTMDSGGERGPTSERAGSAASPPGSPTTSVPEPVPGEETPYVPWEGPPGGPQGERRRLRVDGDAEADQEREVEPPRPPTTPLFSNPVASGASAIFALYDDPRDRP